MSKQPWSPFYWRDYLGDTATLTMLEHGAYLLLMAEYYATRTPLDANASVLHRVCRAFADAERGAIDSVLTRFFHLRDGRYHHKRIDEELAKSSDISEKRRAAALSMHHANAHANAEQKHTQSQSQSHIQVQIPKSKGANFVRPSPEEVKIYLVGRGSAVDPEAFFSFYESNGWKVGKNPMRSWKAAVVTWEKRRQGESNGSHSKALEKLNRNRAAILEGLGISQNAGPIIPDVRRGSDAGSGSGVVRSLRGGVAGDN